MRQYNLVVISGSQSHPTFNNTSGSPIVWNAHLRITVVMERKTRVPKIAKNMGCRDPLWVVISCIFGDLTTDSSACSCNEARRKERQCQRKPEHPVNLKYTVYASVAFAYVRLAEYMASACMCDIIPAPLSCFSPASGPSIRRHCVVAGIAALRKEPQRWSRGPTLSRCARLSISDASVPLNYLL